MPNPSKKWMVSLSGDYYDWIKSTAEEAGVKGSEVITELISTIRKEHEEEFKHSLIDAQVRLEQQKLERQKEEIENRIRELKNARKTKQVA